MVSSSPTDSESTETSRPPAVSSLKSHFEQIASANSQFPSSKKLTVSGLGFPTSTSGLLTVDHGFSPRQRTSSDDLHSRADDHDDGQRPAVHLGSVSSPELRPSKRPPPPPPIRSSKPVSPSVSPSLRPVPIPSLPNPSTVPAKRPPPPIPSSPLPKSDLPLPHTGNVAFTRGSFSRFGWFEASRHAMADSRVTHTAAIPIYLNPSTHYQRRLTLLICRRPRTACSSGTGITSLPLRFLSEKLGTP